MKKTINDGDEEANDEEESDGVEEMLEDAFTGTHCDSTMELNDDGDEEANDEMNAQGFESLLKEARRELYPNCTKFSTLSFLVKLLHIKVLNHWSN
jgi:hypothetical protein